MTEGKTYYEVHVTMTGDREACRAAVARLSKGWRFSHIDGDINLGDGLKSYATKQFNARLTEQEVVSILLGVSLHLSRLAGVTVVRRKVERVLFDDRSSEVGVCSGGCPECHTDDLSSSSDATVELLKALRNDIVLADPEILTDTLWTNDVLGMTVVDRIDHALSALGVDIDELSAKQYDSKII